MPCESYREVLVEAAASGAEPAGALSAHLQTCVDCQASLARQQAVFASIDSCLQAAANAGVPPSLLPRLRVALEEETIPKNGWFANRLFLGAAAAVFLVLFVSLAVWYSSPRTVIEPIAAATSPPVPSSPVPQNQTPIRAPQANSNSVHSTRRRLVLRRGESMPEVLVPRDEEFLLDCYAVEWRNRKPRVAEEATLAPQPLKIVPIQVAQLDVKPLAEENSQ